MGRAIHTDASSSAWPRQSAKHELLVELPSSVLERKGVHLPLENPSMHWSVSLWLVSASHGARRVSCDAAAPATSQAKPGERCRTVRIEIPGWLLAASAPGLSRAGAWTPQLRVRLAVQSRGTAGHEAVAFARQEISFSSIGVGIESAMPVPESPASLRVGVPARLTMALRGPSANLRPGAADEDVLGMARGGEVLLGAPVGLLLRRTGGIGAETRGSLPGVASVPAYLRPEHLLVPPRTEVLVSLRAMLQAGQVPGWSALRQPPLEPREGGGAGARASTERVLPLRLGSVRALVGACDECGRLVSGPFPCGQAAVGRDGRWRASTIPAVAVPLAAAPHGGVTGGSPGPRSSHRATRLLVWLLGEPSRSDPASRARLPVVVAHACLALDGANRAQAGVEAGAGAGAGAGAPVAPAAGLYPLRLFPGAPVSLLPLAAAAAEQRAASDPESKQALTRRPEHLGLFFADAEEPWGAVSGEQLREGIGGREGEGEAMDGAQLVSDLAAMPQAPTEGEAEAAVSGFRGTPSPLLPLPRSLAASRGAALRAAAGMGASHGGARDEEDPDPVASGRSSSKHVARAQGAGLFPAAAVVQLRPLAAREGPSLALPGGTMGASHGGAEHDALGETARTVASVAGSRGGGSSTLVPALDASSRCTGGELLLRVAAEEGDSAALEALCAAGGGLLSDCGSGWALRRRRRVVPLLGRLLRRARARDVRAVLSGGVGVTSESGDGGGSAGHENLVLREAGRFLDVLFGSDECAHGLSVAVVDAWMWGRVDDEETDDEETDEEEAGSASIQRQERAETMGLVDGVLRAARGRASAALSESHEAAMAAVGFEAATARARRLRLRGEGAGASHGGA